LVGVYNDFSFLSLTPYTLGYVILLTFTSQKYSEYFELPSFLSDYFSIYKKKVACWAIKDKIIYHLPCTIYHFHADELLFNSAIAYELISICLEGNI